MNLIYYTTVTEGAGAKLGSMLSRFIIQRNIKQLGPPNNIEVYRNIESLSRRLRQPGADQGIAVLLVANKDDLLDILSIRDLLRNVRIILILPDKEEDTIAKGHMLRPRFLSYIDSDFADVFAVLAKCCDVYSEKSGLGIYDFRVGVRRKEKLS
jgi:hypothetical protein